MSAVETLIEQKEVLKRLLRSVESMKKRIKKLKIYKAEKASVLGSMEFLKINSITRSGVMLTDKLLDNSKKYNDLTPSDFFKKAYDLRSKFVHYGITETKYLNFKTIQMQNFVSDLIKEYFNKICC